MEYQVSISGDINDLEVLAKSLTSPNLNVVRSAVGWVLRSRKLDELPDFEAVRDGATQFLAVINAGSVVSAAPHEPLALGAIYRIRNDGGQDVSVLSATAEGLGAGNSPNLKARQRKKGYPKFSKEMISRWIPSGDPNLKKGVHEERMIDKEKDTYDQVVTNAETGEVTHDEHVRLSHHKNKTA